jgi:hypothetical protein
VWWDRNYRAGQVWEYGLSLFLILDDVDWDIRPDQPDTENDMLRIVFLQVGRENGDGSSFRYSYKPGDVGTFHRCSVVVEHARMVT